MRKLFLSSAIMMAVSSASFAVNADTSANLSVTGVIVPTACDVSLSSGTIDFGYILVSDLTELGNSIAGKDIDVNVACVSEAAIAMQTRDNRTSSAMTLSELQTETGVAYNTFTDANLFGLGLDSASEKVGALTLRIVDATLNGSSNNNLLSSTDKALWKATTVSAQSGMFLGNGDYFASAASSGSTSPTKITNATYKVSSNIILKKAGKYPNGEKVDIDGNVTFSIIYL